MASNLITYGLLAAGGFYLYKNYFSTPAVTAPSGPTTPSWQYLPETTTTKLDKAAKNQPSYLKSGGLMTADEWAYVWANSLGKPAVDDGVFMALFFPNGRPTDAKDAPKMGAASFVSALSTSGLSGLRVTTGLPRRLTISHPKLGRRVYGMVRT